MFVVLATAVWTSYSQYAERVAPFLEDSDPDKVCVAAINYQPIGADDTASHTATSPDQAAVHVNDTSYRPGQPLLGSSTV